MALALFDLDNTLLDGDSDYAWGQFLSDQGAVDARNYERTNQDFYEAYREGTLDIQAFLAFALAPLARYPRPQLLAWRETFIRTCITPMVKPGTADLVDHHRRQGDTLVVVTATNSFVTAPIAALLAIPHLIATEPEEYAGVFTGRAAGTPCFREGKVTRVTQWCANHAISWTDSTFYSDSHNDIPLLEKVARPVAIDPDATLATHAQQCGWPVRSLKSLAEGTEQSRTGHQHGDRQPEE
ncbi:MAG: histidinol-phosphatase [Acidiferrobacter sp.]